MTQPEPDYDLSLAEGTRVRVAALAEALEARGLALATAESCTGGLLGAVLTARAGSSTWYLGGVVSYANSAKVALLGVRPETLRLHGAVSRDVAIEMASGCRQRLGADLAVSITGIAGPGGGSASRPIGTVWIACATAQGPAAWPHHFEGDRQIIRALAARASLDHLLQLLEGRSRSPGQALTGA